MPSAAVAKAIIELWKKHKKHANLVLLVDVSGSMAGEKIENAKAGATQLIQALGDEDLLSFMPFNHETPWAAKGLKMETDRPRAVRLVQSCFADGGTSLYDAVSQAHRYLMQNPTPDRISAMVVLSDGADETSRMTLPQLLQQIRSDSETRAVRVFTIGYGDEAREDVLGEIAEKTKARFFHGNPQTIREVFKEIATFF